MIKIRTNESVLNEFILKRRMARKLAASIAKYTNEESFSLSSKTQAIALLEKLGHHSKAVEIKEGCKDDQLVLVTNSGMRFIDNPY